MDKWDACAFPVSDDDLEGRICYGGLDLSSTTDITAFVLVFPPLDEDDKYYVLPYFWIPEETLDLRVRRDHEIAFSRWGAVQMEQNLEGMGFTVVPFGQGFKDMSPPTKELMKPTLEQRIAHGGHPVLLPPSWHLTGQFAVAMIQVLRFMTAGTFCLYNPRIFSPNSAILIRELSLI